MYTLNTTSQLYVYWLSFHFIFKDELEKKLTFPLAKRTTKWNWTHSSFHYSVGHIHRSTYTSYMRCHYHNIRISRILSESRQTNLHTHFSSVQHILAYVNGMQIFVSVIRFQVISKRLHMTLSQSTTLHVTRCSIYFNWIQCGFAK